MNLIINKETINAEILPNINNNISLKENTIPNLIIFINEAPNITGIDNSKVNSVITLLDIPNNRPAIIVAPDLDTPGNTPANN